MATPAITSVDRLLATAGYASCLLDCILEVWKRIYEYACAFFESIFGEPKPAPVAVLPSGVTMIIADYLLMPKQYEDFLFVTRSLAGRAKFEYKFDLKTDLLRRAFISIMGLADCFDAPDLLKKIEEVSLSYYYMPTAELGVDFTEPADISWVFMRIEDPIFLNKRKAEFAGGLEVTSEEFPQAIRDWQTIKKIKTVADAFALYARGEKSPSIYVPFTKAQAIALIKKKQ